MITSKKAQFESVLLAIITIFIIGIILFFMNHVNKELYDKFDEILEEDITLNQTQAHKALEKIQSIEGSSIWDYAFLAIFVGLIIQIVMFSFATRINIAFYWIMVLLDIPILIVGVVLSNIWQTLAVNPEFVITLTRFPITNLLLGTYFPIAVTIIIFIASIILFGKRPGSQ